MSVVLHIAGGRFMLDPGYTAEEVVATLRDSPDPLCRFDLIQGGTVTVIGHEDWAVEDLPLP